MSLRCKKGDLAIMIKGVRVGRIVEVIGYDGFDPVYGHEWRIKTSIPLPPNEFWISPDSWMTPIRPGDLKETEETEREVEHEIQ